MTESNLVGTTTSAPRSATDIAAKILGDIAWASSTIGYCLCPGRKTHSTGDAKRDCVIYLDRVPTIHCMHASCAAEIQKTNRALRAAILNPSGEADFVIPKITTEDKARIAERKRDERIRVRAAKALPMILKNYRWTYDDILHSSPVDVKTNFADHWRLLLGKFAPSDVVWIGDIRDSGSPECAANFKTAEEWLKYGRAPGQFTCPVNFKNTSHAYGATACVFASQAWQAPGKPGDGVIVSESPDRRDIVMLVGNSLDGVQKVTCLPVIRSQNGKFSCFGKAEAHEGSGFIGRFANLLPSNVPDKATRERAKRLLEALGDNN